MGQTLLVSQSCPTLCNSMDYSLCPWNSPGKNIGVGCHSLLQRIFPTQGLNWVSCTEGRFFTVWTTRDRHWVYMSSLRRPGSSPGEAQGQPFFVCFVFLIILLLIYSAVLGLHFCTRAFSSCSLFSRCGAQASHWNSFSWHEAWAVGLTGFSSCSSSPLKHRLRNCCAGLAALRHVGP